VKIQNCIQYEYTITRVIRTALPFELLSFILDSTKNYAITTRDIKRLFYVNFGLLLDKIQLNSALSYLVSNGFIFVRNKDEFGKECFPDELSIIRKAGRFAVFYSKENIEVLKKKLKQKMRKEKSLANVLSYSYLLGESDSIPKLKVKGAKK